LIRKGRLCDLLHMCIFFIIVYCHIRENKLFIA